MANDLTHKARELAAHTPNLDALCLWGRTRVRDGVLAVGRNELAALRLCVDDLADENDRLRKALIAVVQEMQMEERGSSDAYKRLLSTANEALKGTSHEQR